MSKDASTRPQAEIECLKQRCAELEQALEQQRRETVLREDQLEFALNLPIPTCVLSADYRYEQVNHAYAEMFGLAREAFAGRFIREMLGSGLFEESLKPRIDRALAGESLSYRVQVNFPKRGQCWMLVSNRPRRDKAGIVTGVYVHGLDITEQVLHQTEFAAVLEMTSEAYWMVDRRGYITQANPSATRLLGHSAEDFTRLRVSDVDVNHDPDHVRNRFQDIEKIGSINFETKLRHRDGHEIEVEANASFIPLYGGRIVVMARDITHRKMAEAALRDSEERFRSIVNVLPQLISYVDRDLVYRFINQKYQAFFETTPEQIIGRRLPDVIGEAAFEKAQGHVDRVMAGESVRYLENIDYGDKGLHVIDGTLIPDFDEAGTVKGYYAVLSDITTHMKTREALREASLNLKAAVSAARVGLWEWDFNTDEVTFSPEWKAQIGYEAHELEGRLETFLELLHPDDLESVLQEAEQCRRQLGRVYQTEFRLRHRNGAYRCIYAQGMAFHNQEGEPIRMLGSHIDITDKKQAEQMLQDTQQRLQRIADITTDIIYEYDYKADRIIWHSDFESALGYPPEQTPRTMTAWLALIHPEDLEAFQSRASETQHLQAPHPDFYYRVRACDGQYRMLQDLGMPIMHDGREAHVILGGLRDVTRERSLDEQARQSQKMEAIGQLTGGVAHDFNNLLQVINGCSELAQLDLEPDHPAHASLADITKAGKRAARLVQQLLLFSRRQIMRPETFEVNECVEEMIKMLRRLLGETIRLRWTPGEIPVPIHADRGMFEQALMNLCINARDAMPKGGDLVIATGSAIIEQALPEREACARPGQYVKLTVQDHGCGIDDYVLEHMFEPFFTTKGAGHGTGLGLSTVYGIVKQHGGMVTAESTLGEGATMNVYWPATNRPEPQAAPAAPAPAQSRAPQVGAGAILVAEDDDMARNLVKAMLQRSGFEVLAAANGREALALFEENQDMIALVLLDVIMPEMGGQETYFRMRQLKPDVKVIFASGYSQDKLHTDFVLDGELTLLAKPFNRNRLLQAVSEKLET